MSWAVKMKGRDLRRWEFITPKGTTTNPRIHAAMLEREEAETAAKEMGEYPENAGYEFKAVELFPERADG